MQKYPEFPEANHLEFNQFFVESQSETRMRATGWGCQIWFHLSLVSGEIRQNTLVTILCIV